MIQSSERVKKEIELGKAIANMYIAAQHISMTASDAACEAMEGAGFWMRTGFNNAMMQSPYSTRAVVEGEYECLKEEPRW